MLYARDGVFESRVAPTPGLFAPAADVTRPCRRFISVARGSAMCWSALSNLRAFVSSVCLWGGTSRRLSVLEPLGGDGHGLLRRPEFQN